MTRVNGMERDPSTGVAIPPRPADNKDAVVRKGTKRCFCVSKHTPMYYSTRNFFVQRGETYWLCPTAQHSVKALLQEYAIAGGEPDLEVQAYFSRYIRHLANRSWFLDKVARKHVKLGLEVRQKRVN
jgi:hypothetical protein